MTTRVMGWCVATRDWSLRAQHTCHRLPPASPLSQDRFALSSVTLRGLADQPSAAHDIVPGLFGAFEDPLDSAATPRLPVENLGMLDLAGAWGGWGLRVCAQPC